MDGKCYVLEPEKVAVIDLLLRANDWVTEKTMRQNDKLLENISKLGRDVIKKIPPPILAMIETVKSKGSRIIPERILMD